MNNIFKTVFLLSLLTVLLVLLGRSAGGDSGMLAAFAAACVMNFGAFWFSDKIVLGLYRAQRVTEAEAPEFFSIVSELASRAKVPMPALYVIPSASPNAFAAGRDPAHAAVAVTAGILELLNREELEGVLAHEMTHIVHRDTLTAAIAAVLAGAISMLASGIRWTFLLAGGNRKQNAHSSGSNPLGTLLAAMILPAAALLIQLAISRTREYEADRGGGELCGNPLYLASALRKLESSARKLPMRQAEPATAHLFIINPLKLGGFETLFLTHPRTEDRVERLAQMAREKGL